MSYLDKCVSKEDLLFEKLKPSCNLIVFILKENLYFSYTLSDLKNIMKESKQHYIEGKENLETFFYLVNGIKLDSSFQDCFDRKINTMFLIKNENKFRIGVEEGKQIFSYYTVKPALRKDIDSDESDTFSDSINVADYDSNLDWTEIKQQQEARAILENRQMEIQTGNYSETKNHDFNVKQILIYENFKLKEEKWFKNEKLHREGDLPALTFYKENRYKKEIWLQNGERYRENDLPNEVFYFEDKSKEEVWVQNNKIDRKNDLPARIGYYSNGNIKKESWYRNGLPHREGGLPAIITYYENKLKKTETWFRYGERHREDDKPAVILYFENGNKEKERWCEYNQAIRKNNLEIGIDYYMNGNYKLKIFGATLFNELILNGFIKYDQNGNKIKSWFRYDDTDDDSCFCF